MNIKRTSFVAATLLGLVAIFALPAAADQVILDDLIVDGSICAGFDCVNGMAFGFDTLVLRENNVRMFFDDTSTSASFPSNDWRLTANDSSNGGLNHFSIDDASGGRTPFRIEAGAPTNSLYVESSGEIGMGTSDPVVQLHVKDGNTPTLRLEQDGSSGFASQTWDVAGNEANFFIRDATNGSALSFRIIPGAPTNSMAIAADGRVGLGTNAPQSDLHVIAKGNNASIDMESAAQTWRFSVQNSNGNLNIRDQTAGVNPMVINPGTGGVTLLGAITTGGPMCSAGCDEVFSPDYELQSIEEHAAAMWQNQYLPAVGPTIPKAPINLTEKTGNMLNELEKAHIYIEQLHDRLAKVEAQLVAAQAESTD